MKRNKLLYIALLALFSFFVKPASASHLVGGSLGYEYIGPSVVIGGVQHYQYRIILVTYNNCDNTSSIPLPVANQEIWVYDQDIANNPMGGGDKDLYTTINLPLVDSNLVEPPTTSGCSIGGNVCIYRGQYEGLIDLPLSFNGYHLVFDDFARNGAIDNLVNPGGTGMAFHSFIAPTLVNNSSPYFTDDPVPFLCVGDTVSILNTAIDPDGDLLVFSFVDPMGGLNGFGAAPDPITWPINIVNWDNAGGYDLPTPFGPSGYSFINGSTGLTSYMSPTIGNYVVAIEIREFRNGNLIGVSRRDLQLLVINCPPNDAPTQDPTSSTITQYSVEEGDQLCFDIDFADANGDSITLDAQGQLFDPLFTTPAATINTPVDGDSTVTSQFCWNTACGQAQALPYQFSVSVTDNGCPPKTINVVYEVTVNPFQGPQNIFGPFTVCENETSTYTTDTIAGAVYTWSATGGVITGGQGTNTITVDWGTAGPGLVEVFAISPLGCPSSPTQVNITIVAPPNADAGSDTFICAGDTVQIGGSPTGPNGATYSWMPATNIDNANASNPNVFPPTTTDYIVTVDIGLSCTSTDTVTVTVGAANADAGTDTAYCIGDSVQLNATGGTSYSWSPATGLSDPNISNPYASGTTTTMYYVTITDINGCVAQDSVLVTVNALPVADAGLDSAICDGSSIVLGGSPTGPAGSTFDWTNPADLDNANAANPTATPTASPTTYMVTVTDANGCVDTDDVTITLNPNPTADAGNDATICDGDSTQLNATGGGTYAWSPTTGLSDPNIADPFAFPSVTTTYTVTVTDINGCTDTDDVIITVNPTPVAEAGADDAICIGQSAMIGGSPTGPGGASFSWTPAATLDNPSLPNPTATPTTTTTYVVTVTDANGCVSMDSMQLTVNPLPVVDAGNDVSICDGSSTVLGGTPTGPVGSTYSWSPAGTLDDAALANPTATPTSSPTTYTVTVTDANGCVNTGDVTVSLFALPTPDAGVADSICIGDSTQLQGTGGPSYAWTPAASLSDATLSDPFASPTSTTMYYLTVTDANNCSATDSVEIVVHPLPVVDAGPDLTICLLDTVQIGGAPTGPAGATYDWQPNTDLDDGSLANPMAWPADTTTFVVTVTDTNGCVNQDSMVLNVNPLPPADAGTDATICDGDSTQLNASGGVSYSWSPTTNLSDPNIADPWASPSTTTQYIVTVTDVNNCSTTDTVIVNINNNPVADAGQSVTICIGDSTQFNATGGTNYSWTPTTGLSDPNIADPWASPTDTTTYIVNVTGGNGCFAQDSLTVFVLDIPTADAGPDLWLCDANNNSVQLNASGGVSYAWSPATGLSDPNIADPFASPTDTTEYIVTVTDANNCSDTDTMTVIVNDDPPIDAGIGGQICIGDSIMLGGNPTSVPGANYTWTPTPSLDDNSIANPMAFPTDTTMYYLTVTSDTCSSMDSVMVIVNPLPTADAGSDVQICINDSVQLNATGGDTYAWTPGATLSDSMIADPWASPLDTTMYYVTVVDSNLCVNMDSMTVVVNPIPVIDAGNDTAICATDSIQLMASGAQSYVWSPATGLSDPNIANPMASPTTTTMYYVAALDSNSCGNIDSVLITVNALPVIDAGTDATICFGDSTQLNATGGVSYSWTPSTGLNDPSIADPWAMPGDTMMYYVTGTDANACMAMDSVTVNVNPLPIANAGIDLEICIGAQAHLNATGGVSYSWSPAADLDDPNVADPWATPTDTTTYVVTVTDANGCMDMDTMVLTVNPLPLADAGNDINICLMDTVQLSASGGVTYTWTPATDISDPMIPDPLVYPDTTTMYYVAVRDTNNCEAIDSVMVNVFRVEAFGDTALCAGDSAQLLATGVNATTFVWTPASGLNDPNIADPWASPSTTTTYTATVTDNNGCVDAADVTIVINPDPVAQFDAEFEADCDGLHYMFTNNTSGGTTYVWDFGADGSTAIDPDYTFPYDADYGVVLTATNEFGCIDTATLAVGAGSFEDYFEIIIPNVFTPNGDGINDFFEVNLPGRLGECVEMNIYTRWGQVVFISSGNNLVWDGRTPEGSLVTNGTYFYTINIRGVQYNGSVTVLE